ncbi:MAG: hypothetical protein KF802_02245 [Bdellovibrionaceae bacterium]|nr:hypothetical protein [Pseudobdellovibrionaceae bacterium]
MAKKRVYTIPEDLRSDQLIQLAKAHGNTPVSQWPTEIELELPFKILYLERNKLHAHLKAKGFLNG